MSEGFEQDISVGAGGGIGNTPDQSSSFPDMLGKALSHEANLARDQAQRTVDDFINYTETYASKAQAEKASRSFNDMSDAELMECLSEYLGSGVANVSINNSLIEEMQRIFEEASMSEEDLEELDNPTSARAMDAKRRKFADRLGDILEDQENRQEERRQLEEWEKEILSKQNIDIGGTTASALEWTNALDQVLDNWDSSFDDMVSQGLAGSDDKDKKKQEVSKLRKIMANPKTSEAEKQKLIQQGLASGEFSPGTVTYVTQVMENNEIARGHL